MSRFASQYINSYKNQSTRRKICTSYSCKKWKKSCSGARKYGPSQKFPQKYESQVFYEVFNTI